MPLPCNGSEFLVALEGEAFWGICVTPLIFCDLFVSPFSYVSCFICTAANVRSFVLMVISQHIGSRVPVDGIPNVDRRGGR